MYNSQYYTCEQIDERLLQGYLDDYNTQTGQSLTKAQFLTKLGNLFSKEGVIDNTATQIGYYECDTAAGTAAKAITVANYALFAGGSMKVKFANKNTANNATLNINSQGAKALYYQGERASATNSWDANEVVEIYYDGTSYYANNVKGGSGSGVYDVSKEHPTSGPNSDGKFTLEYILNPSNVNELIPVNKRYPGMTIQFVSTSDNKYVQCRLMANQWSTTVTDWQGVDDAPTTGSNNLVKSGGVYDAIAEGSVYDISVNHLTNAEPTVYDSLAAALGTNAVNIPASKRKPGMSIKFNLRTQTGVDEFNEPVYTNEYVQYRYMKSDVSNSSMVNINNWACSLKDGNIYLDRTALYKNDILELFLFDKLSSSMVLKALNGGRANVYPSDIAYNARTELIVANNTIYPIKIYRTDDEDSYPLDTIIGYVIFKDYTHFINNVKSGSDGFWLNMDVVTSKHYCPNIVDFLIKNKTDFLENQIDMLIDGDDILIADLNPTWNNGGYYLSDSINLQTGTGFYTSAIDVSEYVGKTVIFVVNSITPTLSSRACIITNENDDRILAVSVEKLNESDYPIFEYDEQLQAYKVKLNIPVGAKYLRMSVSINATERQVKIFKIQEVTPTPEPERLNTIFYVDGISGNDNNDGLTSQTAFKTTAKFVETALNLENCTLIIAGGIYTSTLNLTGLKGNVSIIGKNNETIIFSGSGILTDWTAVDGYNGIYKCSSNASIPVQGQYNNGRGMIFENGRPSKPILDAERHPSQKGLSNRLPFTIIQQSLSVTLTDALSDIETNGGWYSDGSYIYIKNQDGSNPSTNGYSYEYEARPTFVCPNTIVNLIIKNISFRFSSLPIMFNAQFTERYNCSVFGVPGDGFVDNSNRCRSFYDECAVCGNDGANGHYNTKSGWTSDNLRNSGEFVEYYYAWMHDNGDDGMSHHEASHIRVFGGLYEYNGDGGIRLSNTCNGELHDVYARKNGQDTISANVSGSGFDVVNSILSGDTRNGCNMLLYNCVSEENNRGYAVATFNTTRLVLINCLSKNNSIAELYCKQGKLIAKNCKYIQSDSSKIKVVESSGTIDVESYNDFL